jgi:DNA-binding response OmpR family regulator
VVIPSLLITDDDAALRETMGGLFQPRGFRILMAGDGEEALKIVEREEVHLMLLDMHMPKLTGLETLRRVKQFNSLLPCILISALCDESLVELGRRAFAHSVLAKPVSGRLLTSAVDQALESAYGWRFRRLS